MPETNATATATAKENQTATVTDAVERRGFLAGLAALAVGVGLLPQSAAANAPVEEPAGPKKCKWGMVIDLDKCTGCQACAVACRAENTVPVAGRVDTEKGRAIFWMNQLAHREGEYPDLQQQFLPTPCNHCEDPPCIKVCPVGATSQSSDGVTQQIPERCIGCRLCQAACPYGRRYFNWSHPTWPAALKRQHNPDVAERTHGVMEKCTFCYSRIRKVRIQARIEGRSVVDDDVRRLTACASSCPAEAIVFGDLNDPDSEVSRQAKSPRAHRLLEEMGTRPKVIYLREAKWQE